jgi:hypothetical protein
MRSAAQECGLSFYPLLAQNLVSARWQVVDFVQGTPQKPCVDSRRNPTLEQTYFRLGSQKTIAPRLPTVQNAHGNTFRTAFRVAAFSTVHSRYLIRGQNRYPKPMREIPIKRNGQRSKTRSSRCLWRVRLEFGDVPTAATRIGATV